MPVSTRSADTGQASKRDPPAHDDSQKDEDAQDESPTEELDADEPVSHNGDGDVKAEQKEHASRKRKKDSTSATDQPAKAARRSAAPPSTLQLLSFLLSDHAKPLCYPADELEAVEEGLKENSLFRSYSSYTLTPFEELLAAVILSRPISHRLGLRSIRTILNEPYNLDSPKAIRSAGAEKVHQALWEAKTQHKGKTADEILLLADVVLEKFTSADDKEGTKLQKALDAMKDDVPSALHSLQKEIKGLGKTGIDIFYRRIQWYWPPGFPFVDLRGEEALGKLGLPNDAEGLHRAIHERWEQLDLEDDEAKRRRAFCDVLERATGASLEGNVNAVLKAAAG